MKRQVGITLGADILDTVIQVLRCYMCIFERNTECNEALVQQWIELTGVAGCRCQNCLNIFRLPVVKEWEGCGVALVPVVGIAGFRFIAGGALLGLVYLTIQLNFYGIAFFAAGRDGE